MLAGWMNDEQRQWIEYLRTENQVLREKLGTKRILFNDDQRRRLAVQGKILGRKLLDKIGTLFTPDTILRWHRELVAQKWDHSDKRRTVGRPCSRTTPDEVGGALQGAMNPLRGKCGAFVTLRKLTTVQLVVDSPIWPRYSNGRGFLSKARSALQRSGELSRLRVGITPHKNKVIATPRPPSSTPEECHVPHTGIRTLPSFPGFGS